MSYISSVVDGSCAVNVSRVGPSENQICAAEPVVNASRRVVGPKLFPLMLRQTTV